MLTVSHTLAGAAIGSFFPNTVQGNELAFGAAWLSHYVLDALPHWERLIDRHIHGFETDLPANKWPRSIYYQAYIDVLLAAAIIFLVLGHNLHGGSIWQSSIFWGAIGGFFPDLIDNLPYWNRFFKKLPVFKQERAFHQWIHVSPETQKSVPKYTGLITQLMVIGFGVWQLWK
jgi:hypothetical protein